MQLDCSRCGRGAGIDLELGENVLHVGLRGSFADEELFTDFPVGSSIAYETEHFHLTRRQAAPRCLAR